MHDGALERALRRDRALVALALGLLTLLSWAYLWWLAGRMGGSGAMPDMPGMDMSGMDMSGIAAPSFGPWSAADFAFTLSMWSVMMVGMMVPSAAPVVLLYARVARKAVADGHPYAGPGWFLAGYLLVWCAFSAAATLAQMLLERAALLTPMIATRSALLGGAVLVVAGIYQWTPAKNACLTECQSPLAFLQRFGGFEGRRARSLAVGARHGLYCLGCCWALMALLFVGGVMNLLWIAALTVVVLLEKVVAPGLWLSRAAGGAAIVAGVWMAARG